MRPSPARSPAHRVVLLTLVALVALLALGPASLAGARPARHVASPPGLPGDFDGDGEADIAIGVPTEDAGTVADAGSMNVLYGSGGGLASHANQFWNQDSPDVLDQAETGDQFGFAAAVGDFNADGFSDLAVGVPFESIGSTASAGAVAILYGSLAAGLTSDGNQFWSQDSPGVLDQAEAGDQFGSSVAVGDFNGDGFADLAVGVPGEDDHRGAVNVLYGSSGGLSSTGNQLWSQDSAGVLGTGAANDSFGFALAPGDFGQGTEDDLAAGVPYDDEVGPKNGGVVNVLYGSSAGLSDAGNQLWSQDSAGVPDQTEQGDDFGRALAVTDMGNDTHADLAVGAPKEDLGTTKDAGGVNVLYGSDAGLTSTASQFWAQGQDGILGTASTGDEFGYSLVAAEFGNAQTVTVGDLAIGAPFDDDAGATDAGVVNVIYGDVTGLRSGRNQLWSQNSPGVPGGSNEGDDFGFALGAGEFGNGPRWDLAIGVPGEDTGGSDGGKANVLYGFVHGGLTTTSAQLWGQNSDGILDQSEPGDEFGSALT